MKNRVADATVHCNGRKRTWADSAAWQAEPI